MKLTYDKALSNLAFNVNVRRYTKAALKAAEEGRDAAKIESRDTSQRWYEASKEAAEKLIAVKAEAAELADAAGGVLRTSTPPMLNLLLGRLCSDV